VNQHSGKQPNIVYGFNVQLYEILFARVYIRMRGSDFDFKNNVSLF